MHTFRLERHLLYLYLDPEFVKSIKNSESFAVDSSTQQENAEQEMHLTIGYDLDGYMDGNKTVLFKFTKFKRVPTPISDRMLIPHLFAKELCNTLNITTSNTILQFTLEQTNTNNTFKLTKS